MIDYDIPVLPPTFRVIEILRLVNYIHSLIIRPNPGQVTYVLSVQVQQDMITPTLSAPAFPKLPLRDELHCT